MSMATVQKFGQDLASRLWARLGLPINTAPRSGTVFLPMRTKTLLCLATLAFAADAHAAVTIDYVPVGDAGNAADSTGYGAVAYSYYISKYEVTNAQYAEFLNAADASGTNPNGIYNGAMDADPRGGITFTSGAPSGSKYTVKTDMGNKPVNYVSHLDAQRFANWIHNGQGGGSTETGAYAVGNLAIHSGLANVWIPTENEWYKAAYYDASLSGGAGGYWLYPTQSNTAPTVATAGPTGIISNPGTNVANYFLGADWNGQDGNVTTVGSPGSLSASYYGTFDQGGNVYEWNDAVISSNRGLRGVSWNFDQVAMRSSFRDGSGFLDPATGDSVGGFRLASSVPEPSRIVLIAGAVTVMFFRRRRARID